MVKHPEILLEDRIYNEQIRHGGPHLNDIGTDQTAWVHKMFCAFVVCLQQNHDQGSQSRGPQTLRSSNWTSQVRKTTHKLR